MKKLSTYLFLLLFSFQTPSWADDIRDFQIEGMSVGDSLLDYFSEEEIKKVESNPTIMDDKFIIVFSPSKSEIYDEVQITYKINDKKYLIHALDGKLLFENNIDDCKKKLKEIINEVKNIFDGAKIIETVDRKHKYDKSGKTTTTGSYFLFKSNSYADVYCTDWSSEFYEKEGWVDDLSVNIGSSEYRNFLIDYYK